MFKKFKTIYILPVLFGLALFVYAFSQGAFTNVLRFDGPDGESTLVSLTGVVLDAQGKPVEGADLFVGILAPVEQGGEFGGRSKLSFVGGGPTDCAVARPESEYLWFETYPANTNKQGRYDLMLGSTKNLQLKLNGRYYFELKVRKGGDWKLFDLNPGLEDASKLNTCAAEFQSVSGPGRDEITKVHIGDDAVGTDEIENGAITADKIAEDSIDEFKLRKNAVTADKIDLNSVYTSAIQKNAIVDDRVSPAANIGWTKISSDAPWYRGSCRVEVSSDAKLLVWKDEGAYLGGTRVYRTRGLSDAVNSFEERIESGNTVIYKNNQKYLTGITKKYRMEPTGNAISCWADQGIAPECYKTYDSLSACSTARQQSNGRCTALERDSSCDAFWPQKPWGEYNTQTQCVELTYNNEPYQYLRVRCE